MRIIEKWGCAKIRGAKIKGAKIKGARKFKGIRRGKKNYLVMVLYISESDVRVRFLFSFSNSFLLKTNAGISFYGFYEKGLDLSSSLKITIVHSPSLGVCYQTYLF